MDVSQKVGEVCTMEKLFYICSKSNKSLLVIVHKQNMSFLWRKDSFLGLVKNFVKEKTFQKSIDGERKNLSCNYL